MRVTVRNEEQLYRETKADSLLEIAPTDPQGWDKSVENLSGRSFPRKELSSVLLSYNRLLQNDEAALKNIEKFGTSDCFCVFTGQQLGMMGGPAYTILKAISCVQLARKHGAVPMFWLATEDHDIAEIDHTYLIDALGNLKKYHLPFPKKGTPVEALEIRSGHLKVIEKFCEAVGRMKMYEALKEEASYSLMMARVLSELFKGTGLIFVEPRLLRSDAAGFFRKEIDEAEEISASLDKAGQELSGFGETPPFSVAGGTNLFYISEENRRLKIIRNGEQFGIGEQSLWKKELLELCERDPQRFSANAAARPVLQSLLFPVAAYIAGPGELAYYRQLKEYHHYHRIAMPWIVPRISATFITPEANRMLEKCGLQPWEKIPLRLGEKKEEIPFLLHYLRNFLHPHEKPQERVFNWWAFQSQTEENIVHEMLGKTNFQSNAHHYCYL